jgi:hypothetical protein
MATTPNIGGKQTKMKLLITLIALACGLKSAYLWYTPTHVEDEKVIAKLRFMDSSWGHDSRRLFVC